MVATLECRSALELKSRRGCPKQAVLDRRFSTSSKLLEPNGRGADWVGYAFFPVRAE